MSDSYTTYHSFQPDNTDPQKRKVLVTGAAGKIGSFFCEHVHERYDLRMSVLNLEENGERLAPYGEVVAADITDLEAIHRACEGIDTVIHLAGNPSPIATWSSLLKVNIEGTYNTMVAAKAAGCRRVVFASSIHAVSGYPVDRQVMASDPVNPGDLYGVSKCFGEAMGRYMAEQQDLSCIAVRICWFQPIAKARTRGSLPMLDGYVSRPDLTQLLCRCIDDQSLRFAIVHGLSDNHFKRLDIDETRQLLNYQPKDDLSELNPILKQINFDQIVREHDESDNRPKPGIREELERLRIL